MDVKNTKTDIWKVVEKNGYGETRISPDGMYLLIVEYFFDSGSFPFGSSKVTWKRRIERLK